MSWWMVVNARLFTPQRTLVEQVCMTTHLFLQWLLMQEILLLYPSLTRVIVWSDATPLLMVVWGPIPTALSAGSTTADLSGNSTDDVVLIFPITGN